MARKVINFEIVRKIGLALPGVEEGTAYGSPALKLRGKLLACIPTHRSAEPNSLVVCVDREDRADLIRTAPDIYYMTDHYVDFDGVLLRLPKVDPELLRDILRMAHAFVVAKTRASSRSAKRVRRGR